MSKPDERSADRAVTVQISVIDDLTETGGDLACETRELVGMLERAGIFTGSDAAATNGVLERWELAYSNAVKAGVA